MNWNPNAHKGTQSERKARFINRRVKELLGSAYSWDGQLGELNYIGNPLSDRWQTPHERKTLNAIDRNWNEAITA